MTPDIRVNQDYTQLKDLTNIASEFVRENARKQDGDANRVLVHCGSGRGRTGTFITMLNSIITLQEQKSRGIEVPEVSIFSVLRRLRE